LQAIGDVDLYERKQVFVQNNFLLRFATLRLGGDSAAASLSNLSIHACRENFTLKLS
jgi:hypothetical protein